MPGPGGPGGRFGRSYLTEEEKASAPKVTPELLKRVFSYLKPYWKQMLLVICAIFVSSVFSLMPSVLTGRIIDEGLIGRNMSAGSESHRRAGELSEYMDCPAYYI